MKIYETLKITIMYLQPKDIVTESDGGGIATQTNGDTTGGWLQGWKK